MRRAWLALFIVLLAALPVSAGKKKIGHMLKPGQTADLASLPTVVAKQNCDNWAWAATLEAMLRMQGAVLDQTMWITRLNGGEVCLPSAGNWEDLQRTLERTYYVLDDGRKLRLEPRFVPGAPTVPDDLILAVRRGEPRMLVWRGHAYLLAGVVYDESIGSNGSREFEITNLKLLDPCASVGSPQRLVTFTRDKDNAAEIDGVFSVRVVWL